jgi:hypothetical protein
MTTKYMREGPQCDDKTPFLRWIYGVRCTLDALERDIEDTGQSNDTVRDVRLWMNDDHNGTAQINVFVELEGDIK